MAHSQELAKVDYSLFRHVLACDAGSRVRKKGKATYLYDKQNNLLAALIAASLDSLGRVSPAQYYIRQQQ